MEIWDMGEDEDDVEDWRVDIKESDYLLGVPSSPIPTFIVANLYPVPAGTIGRPKPLLAPSRSRNAETKMRENAATGRIIDLLVLNNAVLLNSYKLGDVTYGTVYMFQETMRDKVASIIKCACTDDLQNMVIESAEFRKGEKEKNEIAVARRRKSEQTTAQVTADNKKADTEGNKTRRERIVKDSRKTAEADDPSKKKRTREEGSEDRSDGSEKCEEESALESGATAL